MFEKQTVKRRLVVRAAASPTTRFLCDVRVTNIFFCIKKRNCDLAHIYQTNHCFIQSSHCPQALVHHRNLSNIGLVKFFFHIKHVGFGLLTCAKFKSISMAFCILVFTSLAVSVGVWLLLYVTTYVFFF